MGFVEVLSVNELADGEMVGFEVDGTRILLAKVEGDFFAIGATCTHERSNLDQGALMGHVVYCPLHYSAFDVRNGAVLGPPAECGVPAHEVRVEDGKVLVSIEPLGSAAPPPAPAEPAAPAEPVPPPAEPAVSAETVVAAAESVVAAAETAMAVEPAPPSAELPVPAEPVPAEPVPAPEPGAAVESLLPVDRSTRERVDRLFAEIQSNLSELRDILMQGGPPVGSPTPPPDSPTPPVDSDTPPVEAVEPPPAQAVEPPAQAVAPPPEPPPAAKAEPETVAGAWSLQEPRFMGRLTTSSRYLPLAIAIPAAIVSLLVLASVLFRDGPALPRGDILFEHFLGHGWVDIFTLSLVGVAGALAVTGLRRFWAGLNATLPPGLPLRPVGDAVRETAAEVVAHEDFHDWTTSDVQRRSHLLIFYGFLGLMAATAGAALYTEIFPILGIDWHDNVLSLPLWDPVKIIGNVGGIALLTGLAQVLSTWLRRPRTGGVSTYAEWFFPGSLVLTAVTGFLTEILRFAGVRLAYFAYAVHLVFVFALFVFFPFSKFAHVLYHPAARAFGRRLRKKPASALASRAT